MSIAPINLTVPSITSIAPSASPLDGGADVFSQAFNDAVSKVESFQKNADVSVNNFLSGEGEELHKVALDTQQAQLSFDLFLQVRNKVVAAYQEIMRMQV